MFHVKHISLCFRMCRNFGRAAGDFAPLCRDAAANIPKSSTQRKAPQRSSAKRQPFCADGKFVLRACECACGCAFAQFVFLAEGGSAVHPAAQDDLPYPSSNPGRKPVRIGWKRRISCISRAIPPQIWIEPIVQHFCSFVKRKNANFDMDICLHPGNSHKIILDSHITI